MGSIFSCCFSNLFLLIQVLLLGDSDRFDLGVYIVPTLVICMVYCQTMSMLHWYRHSFYNRECYIQDQLQLGVLLLAYMQWGGCNIHFEKLEIWTEQQKSSKFLSSANEVSTGPTCQFLSVCLSVCLFVWLSVFPVFFSRRLIG